MGSTDCASCGIWGHRAALMQCNKYSHFADCGSYRPENQFPQCKCCCVNECPQIENTSNLTLPFSIQLESLSPTRDRDRQKIPSFLTSSLQRTEIVGKLPFILSSFSSAKDSGGVKQHHCVLLDPHSCQTWGITALKLKISFYSPVGAVVILSI